MDTGESYGHEWFELSLYCRQWIHFKAVFLRKISNGMIAFYQIVWSATYDAIK